MVIPDNNSGVGQPSGRVTLLFTDIEGSTAMWESHPTEMEEALALHDQLVRSAIEGRDGHVFKTVGDAYCAAFSDPRAAIASALDVQHCLGKAIWPAPLSIRVRIGIHTGSCQERDSDYFGPVVNRTARLEAIAHGGQVVVSGVTEAEVRDSLPEGCGFSDLGEHRLKDLGMPEHVFQILAPGLQEDFPPLRSLTNPALEHNLPIQLTSFVGRRTDLAEIRRLINESRLVTLAGPGGTGKTRLALQVAADLLDGSGDGVWFADLASLVAEEQVVREVADTLGVREEAGRPLLETLVESLQYRNLFLVLDNCEHLVEACARLAETLVRRCDTVWILATSREPLAVGGERVYRVPAMGLPGGAEAESDPESLTRFDSVRLFVERARAHRPEFTLGSGNARIVASLCRRLDGIPLALELAAARVGSMSLEDLERRLDQRFRLLGSGPRTATSRQRTLQGAVAWSFDLLADREKIVFSCLSVFPASFDLDAAGICAEAVSLDELDVVDAVVALVDKSLLQAEPARYGLRYRFLETIAEFARERLAAMGDVAMRARAAHALHFERFVAEAEPHLRGSEQNDWKVRIDDEYDNIRRALSYLSESEAHGLDGLRLVASLGGVWALALTGTQGEAYDLATRVLANPSAQSATPERSGALLSLALVQESLGKVEAARASLEAGLAIARGVGATALVAEALSSLAYILYRTGEHRLAEHAAREALDLADEIADLHLKARAHGRLGAAMLVHDADGAREHFSAGLRLYQRVGNGWHIGTSSINLAYLEMMAGDFASARTHVEAALEQGAAPDRVISLLNLGFINVIEGDTAAAAPLYEEALRQSVRIGYFAAMAYAVIGKAWCAAEAGETERSARLHGAADAMIEDQGVRWEPAEAELRGTYIDAVRDQMGIDAFDAEYTRGRDMKRTDAIELALNAGARRMAD